MSSAAAELDTSTPGAARVYDYWLGGKVAFAADRAFADRIAALFPRGVPGPAELVAASRIYLQRGVRESVHCKARQLLDLGAGCPCPRLDLRGAEPLRPLHEVAQAAHPQAACAYVDRDRLAFANGKAAVEDIPGVAYVQADLSDVAAVRNHPDVKAVIDWAQPVTVVFGMVLHLWPAATARTVIEGYLDGLKPGSRVVITVPFWYDPVLLEKTRAAYHPVQLHNHSADRIKALLRGTELLGNGVENAQGAPGLVGRDVPAWVLGAVGMV